MGIRARIKYTRKKQALEKGIIGEGFHGKTYRVAYTKNGQSFSNLLDNEYIENITIHTVDSTSVITRQYDIREFLNFLNDAHGVIAKIFKNQFLITGLTVKNVS